MKLRDDLKNEILKSVIKELHRLVMYSINDDETSELATESELDGDVWMDVYDKVDDVTYSVNITWNNDNKNYEVWNMTSFRVTVYPDASEYLRTDKRVVIMD